MARTIRSFRFEGTTDQIDTCDCCGKSNLKITVKILDLETGEELNFGTTCAARALSLSAVEVKAESRAADKAREEAAAAARKAEDDRKHALWTQYLIEQSGGIFDQCGRPQVFAMIMKLGGHKAVMPMYAAVTA